MEFAMIGPHQGKTMRLGGFSFKNGVTEVPEDARDAQNLLRNHYGAHPSHFLEKDKNGKLVLKSAEEEEAQSLAAAPTPVAPATLIDEPLASLSRAELKVKASEMGLDATGTKDDLIVRIQAKQA